LILLRLEGPKGRVVEEKARLLGEELRRLLASHERLDAEVLGPAPAPIARLRGRYRWQLLLKGEKSPRLAEMAREAAVKVAQTRSLRLHIDVDPYSML
jgi:primosomal protein N' (replication factor Y)